MFEKISEKFTVQGSDDSSFSFSTIQPEDIPVPDNFVHQPADSIYFIDGNIRTASIKYVASEFVTTDSVVSFYEKYMPVSPYKWKKVAETSATNKKIRVFIKGQEACEVIIERMKEQVVLTIKISPQQG
jgi:hypothetical protein